MQMLDTHKNGQLPLDDIMRAFDTKHHPDYLSGRKSKATISREFMDQFPADHISWQQFQDYYRCVSICSDDHAFESLVCPKVLQS